MQISYFKNVASNTPESTMSIDTFLHKVKSGEWEKQVTEARALTGDAYKNYKKFSVPAVTVSGVFTKRNADSLITHSGFICLDIDHQEIDRQKICSDPYVYALFSTLSGNGYAILVRVEPEKHKDCFQFLIRHFFEQYGIVLDTAPSSVASLRTASYDPNLYINNKAKKSKIYVEPKRYRVNTIPAILSMDETTDLIHQVISRNIDLAPDYQSYITLCFAICSHFGESGRHHFHALCSMNSKYHEKQADKLYDYCLKNPPVSKSRIVSIGSFYFMAHQAGCELPKQDSRGIQVATMGKKAGRTKEDVTNQLVTINNIQPEVAAQITDQVYSREDITLKTLAADPEHLIESLDQYLKINHPLRRNGITFKIEHTKTHIPITEEDINDIYLDCRKTFNMPQVTKDLIQCFIFSNSVPTFNPFTNFYRRNESLYTSTGNIERLIACIDTTTPMAATFIKKWLISLHAAIEGVPVRLMLVLVGPQYNGKTEFFRRLLPSGLMPYYGESKLDRGKDDELLMCQKLIIMDDEMGGKSKQDEKRLKELTSKETFSLRAPYRRDNMDYKRLAVLCGTSNSTDVINDPTGNTRILPIYVKSIDYSAINAIDKAALFMECYRLYKEGETYLITKDEIAPIQDISDDFSAITYEREAILQFFEPARDHDPRTPDYLSATQIKNEIELNSKQQIKNMTRFGVELRKLFGERRSKKLDSGEVIKCYKVIKTSGSQQSSQLGRQPQLTESEDIPY